MEDRYIIDYDLKTNKLTDISFKQGNVDTSILEVTIFEGGVATDISGETIEFRFRKNDGKDVYQDATTGVSIIDGASGKVQCILKSNTLACVGVVQCEIFRSELGKELTTPTFNFTVKSSIGGSGVLSTNYISSIENALSTMNIAESARVVAENLRVSEFAGIKTLINTSGALHTTITSDITLGNTIAASLNADIVTATTKKTELANVIATANTTTYATVATLASKFKSMTFTATVANTSVIPHNLSYDKTKDELNAYDMYSGGLMSLGDEYAETTATGITLLGWTIGVGEQIKFQVIRGVK